jgi:hypothetical protein
MTSDPSNGNAGGGTASDVLLKITQWESLLTEKYREVYRIFLSGKRANFGNEG